MNQNTLKKHLIYKIPNIKNSQQNRPNADFPIWSILLFYTTHITISSYISYPISSYKKRIYPPSPLQPSPYLQARKQPLSHLTLAKSTKCLFLKLGHPHTLQILKFNKSKLNLLFLEFFIVKKQPFYSKNAQIYEFLKSKTDNKKNNSTNFKYSQLIFKLYSKQNSLIINIITKQIKIFTKIFGHVKKKT